MAEQGEEDGVCASAPGKVLLTGAYLVLDEKYDGLVVSLNARMRTHIHPLPLSSLPLPLPSPPYHTLTVELVSPQLSTASQYALVIGMSASAPVPVFGLHPLHFPHRPNPYVEASLLFGCSVAFAILSESIASHSPGLTAETVYENAFATLADRLTRGRSCEGMRVTILADNHFYSQQESLRTRGLSISCESFDRLPKHLPATRGPDGGLQKTGLGSSAALTVSCVAALMEYAGISLEEGEGEGEGEGGHHAHRQRDFLHALAQLVHCFAQGKIGSGFDVSAAVYGSQLYRRFPPTLLDFVISHSAIRYHHDDVTGTHSSSSTLPSPADILSSVGIGTLHLCTLRHTTTCTILSSTSSPLSLSVTVSSEEATAIPLSRWAPPASSASFSPPPGIAMILADIRGGSNTPSMVRKVLQWRERDPPGSLALWSSLHTANTRVLSALRDVGRLAGEKGQKEYRRSLAAWVNPLAEKNGHGDPLCDVADGSRDDVHIALSDAQSAFQDVRRGLQEMGRLSDVPIEPEEQTRLIDAAMGVEGVLMAGVPGAGGYDALFVLVRDTEEDVKRVENLLVTWKELVVLPMLVDMDSRGLVVGK